LGGQGKIPGDRGDDVVVAFAAVGIGAEGARAEPAAHETGGDDDQEEEDQRTG